MQIKNSLVFVFLILLFLFISCQSQPQQNSLDLRSQQSRLRATSVVPVSNLHSIEGYSDVLSVGPGETISFYIHLPAKGTQTSGIPYNVKLFRYGSLTSASGQDAIGSPIANVPGLACLNGQKQDYQEGIDDSNNVDQSSYLIGAKWVSLLSLKLPSTLTGQAKCGANTLNLPAVVWKSGIYTAQIIDPTGSSFDMTFVVKEPNSSDKDLLVVASTNSWQAYNFWPSGDLGDVNRNKSIYFGCSVAAVNKVSFLRPNPYTTPKAIDKGENCPDGSNKPYYPYYRTEGLVAGELRILNWLERNNRNYTMISDADLHASVIDINQYKAIILSTHSEYWSQSMYNNVFNYLNNGGNLIVLSGNTTYWKIINTDLDNRLLSKELIVTMGVSTGVPWSSQEQTNLLGLKFGLNAEIQCGAYSPSTTSYTHTLYSGIPGISSSSVFGDQGVMLGATHCNPLLSTKKGAAGIEVDVSPGFGTPNKWPSTKEYSEIAVSESLKTPDNPPNYEKSTIIYMKRGRSGQVFNVGSISFGQSLLADYLLNPAKPLTKLMLNVLDKFKVKVIGDFNRDGSADLLARKPDGTLWQYRFNGETLTAGFQFESNWNIFNKLIYPGDFNGDGISDIIARKPDGTLWLAKGAGNGTFVQGPIQIGTGWNAFDLILSPGDFNDDGRPDLLARKTDGTLWLYQGNGVGGFLTGAGLNITNPGWNWSTFNLIVSPGDLDRDGNPDLLARLASDGTLQLYRGNGSGGFVMGGQLISSGMNWSQFTDLIPVGDLNRDSDIALNSGGTVDLLARTSSGDLYRLIGNANGIFTQMLLDSGGWNGFDSVVGVW
jgi:hypothetical protein